MMIDARRGDRYWTMWHCELCRNIAHEVQWVDVDYNQYGQYSSSSRTIIIVQARKILCYSERRLLLVNPVDDSQDDEVFVYDANTLTRVR